MKKEKRFSRSHWHLRSYLQKIAFVIFGFLFLLASRKDHSTRRGGRNVVFSTRVESLGNFRQAIKDTNQAFYRRGEGISKRGDIAAE